MERLRPDGGTVDGFGLHFPEVSGVGQEWRAQQLVLRDVRDQGHSYLYDYDYTGADVNDESNSIYLCEEETSCEELTEKYSEFRGHQSVTETGPDGAITITQYHQNDTLRGRPISIETKRGTTTTSLSTFNYNVTPLSLWNYGNYVGYHREWIYTDWDQTTIYGPTTASKKTTYAYEPTYGNFTDQAEYEGNPPVLYRSTHIDYAPNATGHLVGFPARQQVKDASGAVLAETLNLYDGANTYTTAPTVGKLTATRTWTSGTNYSQVSYGYDAWGNRTTVTTYTGYGTVSTAPTTGAGTTTTVFDSIFHVYPLSQTTPPTPNVPAGLTTGTTYDYGFGVPLTETDPNGNSTSAVYDVFGRMTKLIRPGDDATNPTISMAYQDSFPFTTTISQKINSTPTYYAVQRVYDGMGRQTRITSGGTVVDTVYQSATVTKQSVPYTGSSPNLFTTTSLTFNGTQQTSTMTAPDGNVTTSTGNGLVTTVTDARGNTTTSTSDVWGRVLSVVPPTGPSVTYTYDELDRLLTATRGGAVTSLKYDNAGRKINMDDPDMGKIGTPTDANWGWTYTYDALGNLTSQTDARGCVLTLGYDALSRLSSKSSSGAGCVVQVSSSYSYDSGTNGKGYRTGMTDASGSAAWTYDTRGRVLSEAKTLTGQPAYTTTWTYNSADLPVTMTYPDGEIVTTGYNSRMLPNSLTGTNTYVSSTGYDAAGRMTSRALGNTLTQNFTYYGWTETALVDSAQVGQGGRLKNTTIGSLQNLTYVYDAVGNIRSIQDSLLPETQSYGYDTLDRLTSAVVTGSFGYSETYAYNAASGNLTTKGSLTLNYADSSHVHAATSAGGNTYAYDANGNQTTRVTGADTYNLKYDAENRLVEVKKNNVVIAAFTFDGDGERVKSVINGTTTLFIGGHYEIKNPGAGQEVSKYYFSGASRIAMRKYTIPVSMAVEYFIGDHLGSTSITTDTTGVAVSRMRYKAWGEVRSTWTSGISTTPAYILPKYTYTGQYSNVDDFGLMFYNARWYDPYLNHFTQPDSIVPEQIQGVQAWDRYSYASNNPVRYNDPTGHWGFDLSATVNSIIRAQITNPVNTVLNILNTGITITNTDVAKGLDVAATALDVGAAAISTAIAAGEAVAATVGFVGGAAPGIVLGGEPAVLTGPAGAGLGVATFELNPGVRLAAGLSDGLGWVSTGLTTASDVITGDTNVTGSVSVSGGSVSITQSSSIGRDTVSSGYLSVLGSLAPLGIMDAPIDYVGLAFDVGLPWKKGPLTAVPESIPLTKIDVEIDY